MATYTNNFNLKKPAENDFVDIADLNENMDKLDTALVRYATCSTAAATVAKTVTIPDFKLFTGALVFIKFTVTNTATNPTLNISSTGAKAIQYRGSAVPAVYLSAKRLYAFLYDGTAYQIVGDLNSNTTYNAFTGATSSAAGKAGLVPAPAAGDQAKFLRSDGTWAEASGGLDLAALAENADPITIQGKAGNNVAGLILREVNSAYSDMHGVMEIKSVNGPPGRVYYTHFKQGATDGAAAAVGTHTGYYGVELVCRVGDYGYLQPLVNDTYSLGSSTRRWSAVFATNGTIDTSDASEKSDIVKIPQDTSTGMMRAKAATSSPPAITHADMLEFFKNIDIYTYVTDPSKTLTVQGAVDANQYEKVHVGLMANDIADSKLFPFVGYKDTENPNASLGVKYESMGVLALYAIRDLYSKIEALENRIAEQEGDKA